MKHGAAQVRHILDVGCSAGVSTRALGDAYPQAAVTGLDLSTHFLAVAELRERHVLPVIVPHRHFHYHRNTNICLISA